MRNAVGARLPASVGCAGWNLPKDQKEHFPESGSHLERYAARFPAVEINSSFYRPHRASTYARWANAVPPGFRFSVKMPRAITHAAKLEGAEDALAAFLGEVAGLETKLGCILIQTPPSLALEPKIGRGFFELLRRRTDAVAAFEPRHASWLDPEMDSFLRSMRISRVAADPPPVPAASRPGGWREMSYHRLHGSPRVYYSSYPKAFLRELALQVAADQSARRAAWCIFDNTALGAAIPNALELMAEIHR